MRIPPPATGRARPRRRTIVLLALIAAVVIILVVGQALAGFYSNFLWFHSSGVGNVWSSITASKVVLAAVFTAIGFALVFVCLFLVDKVVSRSLFLAPDTELVRRYQAVVTPHALAVRLVVSVLAGLALGIGTSSQWQNWLLFTHAVPFGQTDPVFGRDLSFFVFRLPFLSFLVDWMFGALIVAFIVTSVAYFLNGAIRLQGGMHVEARAVAHLSLLLSLMALERAWAYYFVDRFTLDITSNGYPLASGFGRLRGASYTDVHVRLPALEFLAIVSLIAFMLLAFNVYQRTWTLPVIAVGLWALLAITVGVIFPAVVQAFKVTPAQSTLEGPYIERNINATRQAMGIADVTAQSFPVSQDLLPAVLNRYQQLLSDVQLWDPTYSLPTFTQLQKEFSYYTLTNLAVDRYKIHGQTEPVVIGARALNTTGLESSTWVNSHLEYTHGYGAVVAQSNGNEPTSAGGNPSFLDQDVPVNSSVPSLQITQPYVYFAPGQSEYVVVNSKQAEVDYQSANGGAVSNHYSGSGGVPLSNLFARLAFSIHLHDFNLLISNDITSKSKLIYIPDVRTEVQTAFPFLTIDSNPYPVIDNGKIEWMVDGYTESNSYPYGQSAATSNLPSGSALNGTYDYVRDAVKIEVNAYTGKMTAFAMTTTDPVLKAWEEVYPGLFKPASKMDATLKAHLRYPQDLLMLQAQMYGLYHVNQASVFYQQQSAWDLSPTSTGPNGSPSSQLQVSANGQVIRYAPIYEMTQLAGDSKPVFRSVEPLVRFSSSGDIQNLTSLLIANSGYGSGYGALSAYDTPSTATIDSPGLANADIAANTTVSEEISLLDQKGSQVTLGTVQILPVADSLLYVRPLYVSSSQTSYPLLQDIVVLYGKQVGIAPTLDGALAKIFGASVSQQSGSSGSSGTGTVPEQASQEIARAATDYKNAQTALQSGNLGAYQSDVTAAGQAVQAAESLLGSPAKGSKGSGKPTTQPTTTTVPTIGSTHPSGPSGPTGPAGA